MHSVSSSGHSELLYLELILSSVYPLGPVHLPDKNVLPDKNLIKSATELDAYFRKIPGEPEEICDWFGLDDCIRVGSLFRVARKYLEQKVEPRWEEVMEVLCKHSYHLISHAIAEKYHLESEYSDIDICPDPSSS